MQTLRDAFFSERMSWTSTSRLRREARPGRKLFWARYCPGRATTFTQALESICSMKPGASQQRPTISANSDSITCRRVRCVLKSLSPTVMWWATSWYTTIVLRNWEGRLPTCSVFILARAARDLLLHGGGHFSLYQDSGTSAV